MFDKAVPFCYWEVWGAGSETGEEMIFKSADGTFGGIAAMVVGRGKLEC